ncbi:MAG: homocysteine S-methyltransferase family protein, partial [Actinomycetes bacterium]
MTSLSAALSAGPVVLDGGLSTELEARGHDVSTALWSARLLRDDPEAIVAAHAAFADAGAQVVTTASYQATFAGFASVGLDAAETRRLIASSVPLARRGAPQAWVAGSVGPYGAMLADGSEYTGDYVEDVGVRELRAFHRPRMELLAEAGA